MELHQLRYFVAVADEGSFTRAANRVHVSQSGVSAQLRALETDLGQPLLDRSTRQVRLTPTGAAVLPHARAALAEVAAARQAADDVAGLVRGSLRVGMIAGCRVPPFLQGLADLHAAHPDIRLCLHEQDSQQLQRAVLANELDAALVGYAEDPLPGLACWLVADETVVAAVPSTHRFAQRPYVRWSSLADESVVCMPVGTGIRAAVDAGCSRAGCRLVPAIEASSPEAVAGLAARGLGVGILSESMLSGFPDLRAVALRPTGPSARLGFVWRQTQHLTAATRALLTCMRSTFGPTAAAT